MEKPDFIAQIEGHGALNVNWQKNKVLLEVQEGERLFEGMVVGRPATDLYWISPRICGVCPIAHNMGALKAVEDALGLKPSPSTVALRKLLLDSQMIQSHVLHLYFLAAPDYLGLDTGVEIIKTHPKYFQQSLELKRVSDLIADTVGGRGIHPTATYAGGFHKVPSVEKLKELKAEAAKMLEAAEGTVHLFSSLTYPDIKTNLVFFSQTNGKTYDTYEGKYILTRKKLKVKTTDCISPEKQSSRCNLDDYKKIIDKK